MARDSAPKKVVSVNGIVGSDPIVKENVTDDGADVLEFRLAVTTSYDEDAESKWFDVAVWNTGLIDSVEAEIYKGAKVAVEGTYSTRESNDKTYHKISAARVGLVEWLSRSKSTGAKPKASGSSTKRRSSRDDDDEEEEEEEKPARRSTRTASRKPATRSSSRKADEDDTEDDDLPW